MPVRANGRVIGMFSLFYTSTPLNLSTPELESESHYLNALKLEPNTRTVDFNTQPFLENELVLIRPLQAADREPLYAVVNDPLIWEQHPVKRYKRGIYEPFFEDSIASGGALVIVDKTTGKIIGSSRYRRLEGVDIAIEIGFSFLARAYWGGAYNRSVKTLMLEHAFKSLGVVIFYIGKDNLRSRKAVEKLGGEQIFIEDYPDLVKHGEADVTYQIRREAWKANLQ